MIRYKKALLYTMFLARECNPGARKPG